MTDTRHPRLLASEAADKLSRLDAGWAFCEDGKAIERRVECKGFAKAVYLANLAAYHADRQGHHPDVTFGFGYCTVRYTTHDVDGLSENDFQSAAAFDDLVG